MMKKILCLFLILTNFSLFGWTPPVQIEINVEQLRDPKVVIDPAGNGVAVWLQGTANMQRIRFSTFNGAVWSASQDLMPTAGTFRELSLVIDGAGNAYATWEEQVNLTDTTINFSFLPFAGVWNVPLVISTSFRVKNPNISVAASGDGFVVFENRLLLGRIDAVPFSLGVPGISETISSLLQGAREPFVVKVGTEAIAVWRDVTTSQIFSAENLAGVWQVNEAVADTGQDVSPRVARSSTGFSLASWEEFANQEIRASFHPPLGSWSTPPEIISNPGGHFNISLAVDSLNNGLAIWEDGFNGTIEASSFDSGTNSWSFPPDVISTGNSNHSASLSLNTSGDGWAIWVFGDQSEIQVIDYSAGVFGVLPQTISNGEINFNPAIHTNTAGQSLAVWAQTDGINYFIQASQDP